MKGKKWSEVLGVETYFVKKVVKKIERKKVKNPALRGTMYNVRIRDLLKKRGIEYIKKNHPEAYNSMNPYLVTYKLAGKLVTEPFVLSIEEIFKHLGETNIFRIEDKKGEVVWEYPHEDRNG